MSYTNFISFESLTVLFRAAGVLAAVAYPGHLLFVNSRGCATLPPSCDSKYLVNAEWFLTLTSQRMFGAGNNIVLRIWRQGGEKR